MKRQQKFSVMRLVLALAGGAALLYFLILMLRGIRNLGSYTGAVVALMVFLSAALLDRIKELRKKKLWLVVTNIFLALSSAIAVTAAVLTGMMIHAAAREPAEGATAVVLGCRVHGETPSTMLRIRLEKAYEYLTENRDAMCVVSGGMGKGEDISEAEAMYRYLTGKGISPDRIYLEDSSHDTSENIRFSAEVIRENGLSENVAIVSDGFHQYRAWAEAERAGLSAGAVSAKTPILLLPPYYIRELYGMLAEIFLF